MKKIATLLIIIAGVIGITSAQGDYEAFLFSQSDNLGTARFMGAGGAFGATGGDFSALSTNPASIGLYKRHEVTLTPLSLTFGRTNSSYFNNPSMAKNTKYTVPQAGIVLVSPIKRNNNWRYWQFAYGFNRIVDFNNSFRFNAVAHNNTLMNTVLSNVNGKNFQNLSGDGYLAWNNWLIDTVPGTENQYYSVFTDEDLNHSAVVRRSGSIDEMTFSFGGNYNDKLYIGATIGVPFLNFKETTVYSESPVGVEHLGGITGYTMTSEQRDRSAGVNLKLGIIYQPFNFFRLGIGFHTPTFFAKVRDNFGRAIDASYSSGKSNHDEYSNYNTFKLTTPLKFNVSTSFLINKRAFIGLEYEFQDYRMANMYSDNYDYTWENDNIREKYKPSHTLRVGGELNITQVFAIRAGYRLKTSPYKFTSSEYDNTTHYISAGLGFKSEHFYGDLAYVYRINKDSYWLYDPAGTPGLYGTKAHSVIATVGFKF